MLRIEGEDNGITQKKCDIAFEEEITGSNFTVDVINSHLIGGTDLQDIQVEV